MSGSLSVTFYLANVVSRTVLTNRISLLVSIALCYPAWLLKTMLDWLPSTSVFGNPISRAFTTNDVFTYIVALNQ